VAIYRPPRARWPLAAALGIGGLLLGLVIGLALGGSEIDPQEASREIKTRLVSAAGSLDVAEVEYEESVEDGEVVKQTEYEGALSALDSSRARYREVRSAIASLFPSQVEPIDALYAQIDALMRSQAEAAKVTTALQELEAMLKGEGPGG
jgi:hypothetical protein